MKSVNFAAGLVKYSIVGTIKHFLFWPLWWYSGGFLLILKHTGKKISMAWRGIALDVWLKNIFRPMYGQYDAASRIISFIMRLIQIICRLIIMVILSAFILLIPIIYLGLPILAVWRIVSSMKNEV